MKLTSILAIFISTMAVTAIPTADPNPIAAAHQLEARDLTAAECKLACRDGAEAVEEFCRKIPRIAKQVRFFCWGAAAAVESSVGQRACVAFCDSWF